MLSKSLQTQTDTLPLNFVTIGAFTARINIAINEIRWLTPLINRWASGIHSIMVLPRNILRKIGWVWAVHDVVLLDRLVLIVGVLVYGGGRDWHRVVFWIIDMISIVAVLMVYVRVVWVDLVDARGVLVVLDDVRNGCYMMYYLMANWVRIGWVGILMQVLNMFFIGPVSATDVIVFYQFLFFMHLVRGMMFVFM